MMFEEIDQNILSKVVETLTLPEMKEDIADVAKTLGLGTAVIGMVPGIKEYVKSNPEVDDRKLAAVIYSAIIKGELENDKKMQIVLDRLIQKYNLKKDVGGFVKRREDEKAARAAFSKEAARATGEDPRASRNR